MNKSLVQQQFGAHAASYATSPVHAKGASLGRLIELVKPQPHWQGLDVATGAGHTAIAFAPYLAGVIASDLTDEMLQETAKLAASRGCHNVQTARADAEALPFPDSHFDLVTCRIAAHHFAGVPTFVAEVWRVLRRGGTLALVDNVAPDAETTPGFSDAELQQAALAYNAFEKLRDPSHARCLTMVEWSEALVKGGFTLLHKERLAKGMQFTAWAERMGCDAATIERLRAMLNDAPPALKAFLNPQWQDNELWMSLDEAIIIARKPL
jgi:ubiquinone/menaquinone biosynthesis C-methylase UbiE